jgi:hypothetical protein
MGGTRPGTGTAAGGPEGAPGGRSAMGILTSSRCRWTRGFFQLGLRMPKPRRPLDTQGISASSVGARAENRTPDLLITSEPIQIGGRPSGQGFYGAAEGSIRTIRTQRFSEKRSDPKGG